MILKRNITKSITISLAMATTAIPATSYGQTFNKNNKPAPSLQQEYGEQKAQNQQLITDDWLNSVKYLLKKETLTSEADPEIAPDTILKNTTEAVIAASQTIELPPPLTGEELITEARKSLENGNLLLAEKLYKQMDTPYENPSIANFGLSLTYARQGKFEEAHKMLNYIMQQELHGFFAARNVKNELSLILAQKAQENSNFNESEQWLRDFLRTQEGNTHKARFNRLMRTQASETGKFEKQKASSPLKVGVLLPLTGDLEHIGNNMLKAIQLAMFDNAPESIIIYPHDTTGTPEGAKEAALNAIRDNIDVVIGPLLSSNVETVANKLRFKNIPLIAFSSDEMAADNNIYLINLLPKQQAKDIAKYAISLGKQRVAAIIPEDTYGHEIFNHFADEFQRLGGEIIIHSYYDPNSTDHTKALEKLLNIKEAKKILNQERKELEQEYKLLGEAMDDKTLQRLKELKKAKPKPIIEFDSIFIPASARNLPLLASQLAFYDIDPQAITFLGTSRWQNDEILKDRAEYIRGALFTGQPNSKLKAFKNKFKNAYNSSATNLDSLAYDAVKIICELHSMSPHNKRKIADQLTRPEGFTGNSGAFKFLKNGKSEREYDILRVTSRSFVAEQPAASHIPPNLPDDLSALGGQTKQKNFFSFW